MIRPARGRWLLSLVGSVAVLSILASACGGSSKSTATTTAAVTATDTTPIAPATATIDPSSQTTIKARPLSDLTAYRYAAAFLGHDGPMTRLVPFLNATKGTPAPTPTGTPSPDAIPPGDSQYSQYGRYIAPDKYVTTTGLGILTSTTTSIGGQLWLTVGGGVQGPMPIDPDKAKTLNVAPTYWDTTGLLQDFSAFECSSTLQMVNMVQTRICDMDKDNYIANRLRFNGFLNDPTIKDVSDFVCEVALSLDGYPIRLRVGIMGTDTTDLPFQLTFELDLFDINSPSVQIVPPQ